MERLETYWNNAEVCNTLSGRTQTYRHDDCARSSEDDYLRFYYAIFKGEMILSLLLLVNAAPR